MDPPSSDVPKLPDMVMCGDHPSFTKTELNVKEVRPEEKDRPRERTPVTYARITPTASRTEHGQLGSQHALRGEAKKRVRSLEAMPRSAIGPEAPDSRQLLQAAMGSFRWPPYLVCVWVAVLLLTHALHAVAGFLDLVLPALKKACQYLRGWTEEAWKSEVGVNQRVWPLGAALITGALYALYAVLFAARAAALWALEPPLPDDNTPDLVTVTDYDDAGSKTNASVKH